MEIIENKALKLLLRNPSRVTEVIPKSKVVGTKGDVSEVLVHWGFDECIVLKNLGIKNVPSPINKDYAWHGLYKPFSHQKETAAFLTLHKRAYCLNEMGTGKTVSVLWAADYLMTKGYIRRVLIVCPLSIMHSAWKADAFKSVMHRTVDVAHGSREKRTEIIKGSADIVVINYDGIEIVADAISKSKFDLIVIDECFPKGTKVFTPSGDKNIEDIREGDIIESSWGPRPVTKVFKKQTELLVEVSFDDGKKIKCTPEHPFATTEGWIAAKDLQGKWCINSEELPALRKTIRENSLSAEEDSYVLLKRLLESGAINALYNKNMPVMRGNFHKAKKPLYTQSGHLLWYSLLAQSTKNWGVHRKPRLHNMRKLFRDKNFSCKEQIRDYMLKVVRNEMEMGEQTKIYDDRCEKSSCIKQRKTWDKAWPYAGRNKTKTKIKPVQRKFYDHKRGKWNANASSREINANCVAQLIYPQLSNPYKNASWVWVSNMLQTRFCGSYPNDLYRSGWGEPFAFSKTGARQEKRTVFNGVRVDSVAYIEQNGICDVWNLEVDGPNDYIVNGVLVHNCNHYKNSNSKRWKVMNSLVKPNTWLWGLTGSPASQSPTDAYGLAKLMNPSSVPPFFGGFRDDVMYKVTQYKYIPRPNAMELVYKVLQPAVRFTKAECLDLPERTYTTREVPLSAQQKKYYKQLKEQMLIEAAGEEISTANAAINLNKLMQIASGAVYSDNKEVIEFDCNNRLTALEEIVEEASKKVIVFATFKHSIAVLQEYLSKKGYSTDVIHGGVPLNRRSEIFSNFQTKPDPHILIIQPRSASHGVTLTAANVVVWWSPTPSVETYIQANDRVHRAGQDTPCTVVHLCGSPVEERFYKALEQKGNLLDGLLDLYKDVLQA